MARPIGGNVVLVLETLYIHTRCICAFRLSILHITLSFPRHSIEFCTFPLLRFAIEEGYNEWEKQRNKHSKGRKYCRKRNSEVDPK